MSSTKYIVELTRDEALAIVMATRSGVCSGDGRLASVIYNIGAALNLADEGLAADQYSLYNSCGCPSYYVGDAGAPLNEDGDVTPLNEDGDVT